MRKLKSDYESRLKKIYGIQLTMVDGEKIYSDADGWKKLEESGMLSCIKEYKHRDDNSFLYDGSTYVNPKYVLYARPMMINLFNISGDD